MFDLGINVSGNVAEVLEQSGLNYTVNATPVQYTPSGFHTPFTMKGRFVNYREDNKMPFGIVRSKYTIVQNQEAFSFLDLIPDLNINRAGHLLSGGWVAGCLPEFTIFDEQFSPYVFVRNAHDGSAPLSVCFTPIHVKSESCINVALNSDASFLFTARHTQIIRHKMSIAEIFIKKMGDVCVELKATAEAAFEKKLTAINVNEVFEALLKVRGKSDRNFDKDKAALYEGYYADSNVAFRGTGYGVLLAVGHYVTHHMPTKTKNKEAIFHKTLFKTNPMLYAALKLVMSY